MIPFSPPRIDDKICNAVVDALKSGWITTGPRTKEFEKKLTEYCGNKATVCGHTSTIVGEIGNRQWQFATRADQQTSVAECVDHFCDGALRRARCVGRRDHGNFIARRRARRCFPRERRNQQRVLCAPMVPWRHALESPPRTTCEPPVARRGRTPRALIASPRRGAHATCLQRQHALQ